MTRDELIQGLKERATVLKAMAEQEGNDFFGKENRARKLGKASAYQHAAELVSETEFTIIRNISTLNM